MAGADGFALDDPRFVKLYESAYRQVVSAAYLIVRDLHTAEDLTQDAFLELLRKDDIDALLALPSDDQLKLLRTIAMRRGIDHARRRRRLRELFQQRIGWTTNGTFTHVESDVLIRDVVRAITEIPDDMHRAIAVLAWLHDQTSRQIATATGLSDSRVRAILGKLRERFRPALVEVETEAARPQEGSA
jgi:RNA polymerase sigma factor (sigma-70 family)